MAADPVAKAINDLDRTMKSVDSSLRRIANVLEAFNSNYVETHRSTQIQRNSDNNPEELKV